MRRRYEETRMTEPQSPLPGLHQAVLDEPTVRRLFADLQACAEVFEVRAKQAAREQTRDEQILLDEARDRLLDGSARGVQVRYRYQGEEWWDTLLRTESGFRLTRIRQDAGPA